MTAEENLEIVRIEKRIINLFLKKRIWLNIISQCFVEDSELVFYYYYECPDRRIDIFKNNDKDIKFIMAMMKLIHQNIIITVEEHADYDNLTLNEAEYKKSSYYTE